MKLLVMQFSLFGPTILLSTLNLYSSLDVRDEVLHPYRTTGRIIALYSLTFKFLDSGLTPISSNPPSMLSTWSEWCCPYQNSFYFRIRTLILCDVFLRCNYLGWVPQQVVLTELTEEVKYVDKGSSCICLHETYA
jgi:hypothetical protein